jgi:hypothetical protein
MRGVAVKLAAALAATAGLVSGSAFVLPRLEAAVERQPPHIREPIIAFFELLREARPVALRASEAWEKVPIVVEADDLLRDPTVWNRMPFDDWDRVPEPLRRKALERMIARYRPLLAGPHVILGRSPSPTWAFLKRHTRRGNARQHVAAPDEAASRRRSQ